MAGLRGHPDGGSSLEIRVRPGAPRCGIAVDDDGHVRVRVDAVADQGQANKRLVWFFAKHVLGVPQGDIAILRGSKARDKVLSIRLHASEVERRVLAAASDGSRP